MNLSIDQLITIFAVLIVVYVILIIGMVWYVRQGDE